MRLKPRRMSGLRRQPPARTNRAQPQQKKSPKEVRRSGPDTTAHGCAPTAWSVNIRSRWCSLPVRSDLCLALDCASGGLTVNTEKSLGAVLTETKQEIKEFIATRLQLLRSEIKEKI